MANELRPAKAEQMARLSPNQVLDAAETLDGDIGLETMAATTLKAMLRVLGQSQRGNVQQLAARLRHQYQLYIRGTATFTKDIYAWLVIDATEFVCYAYQREKDAMARCDSLNQMSRNAATARGLTTYSRCRVQRVVVKGYNNQ